MWSDNETEVDLLGFDQLVDAIAELVAEPHLLPLTIGIFGAWGSGKSSLMAMARRRLELDSSFVCVSFSPWQHEDYDDVKSALMATVLKDLLAKRSVFEKAGEAVVETVRPLWAKLARRIDWFRTIGFAAKGLGTVALFAHGNPAGVGTAVGTLDDLRHVLRPEQLAELVKGAGTGASELIKKEQKVEVRLVGQESESIEQSVAEFRSDFRELLQRLPIRALVVFIDDLDRCLPPNVIDMLEALRLFLAVEKTAFVIGADENIVRYAIASRYPEVPGHSVDVGRDYLEKIIQVPLRVPPLTASETETYLNLLGCERALEPGQFDQLVAVTKDNRRTKGLGVAMNYGIARSHLGTDVPELATHMELIARIAHVLSGEFQGNPRYTKRFMNTLLLRRRIARARNVELDQAVLAKLMLLEYFHETQFRQLYRWQAQGSGKAALLVELERTARAGEQPKGTLDEGSDWVAEPWLTDWLILDPPLADVDLDPYYSFSRDRLSASTSPGRRLGQRQQEFVAKLLSESDAERAQARKDVTSFGLEEFRPVFDEMLSAFRRDPRALQAKLGPLLADITFERAELRPGLARTLRELPPTAVQPALAVQLTTTFKGVAALPADLREVLQGWSTQSANPRLADAARRALNPPPPRARSR